MTITPFMIYCLIALIFGAFYSYQMMKPAYAQYSGEHRIHNRTQRAVMAAKLGGAYMVAWLAAAVLMPLALAEGLYKVIVKYEKARKAR